MVKLMHRFLEGLYHYLDLNGAGGKPSQSKVLVAITQFTLLVGLVRFGMKLLETNVTGDLPTGFLLFTLIVAVAPYGLDGLKTLLKTRFGGLSEAQTEAEKQRASVIEATSKAIAARRGSGDVEPTEAGPA